MKIKNAAMLLVAVLPILCLNSSARIAQKPAQKKIATHRTKNKPYKTVSITLPKAGTHLLLKCLTLLGVDGVQEAKPSQAFTERARSLNQKLPPYHYKGTFHIPTVGPLPLGLVQNIARKTKRSYTSHWPYTQECEQFFNKHTIANFFMLRDPRDQLVSMAFMLHKHSDGREMPVNNIILDLIDGRQKSYIPWGVEIHDCYPLMWELGIVGFYNLYLPWTKAVNFYTVKFENLIGPQGGGTKETQVLEIHNIAKHLGLKLSPEHIENVITNIFGNTWTFREGQIGGWKKHFTSEMKAAFKQTTGACQLLINLGYEKDMNW